MDKFHVHVQTNIKKCNLYNFYDQDKSKTIEAIDLKQRLKVANICIIVFNSFEMDRPDVVSLRSVHAAGDIVQKILG